MSVNHVVFMMLVLVMSFMSVCIAILASSVNSTCDCHMSCVFVDVRQHGGVSNACYCHMICVFVLCSWCIHMIDVGL
jgi:hypothetical protein